MLLGNNINIRWPATSRPPSTPRSPSTPRTTQTGKDQLRRLRQPRPRTHRSRQDGAEGGRAGAGPAEGDRSGTQWGIQLPKSKVNVNRKMRNKIIPSQTKGEEIVLMESGVFPAIYFKKSRQSPTQQPCGTSSRSSSSRRTCAHCRRPTTARRSSSRS